MEEDHAECLVYQLCTENIGFLSVNVTFVSCHFCHFTGDNKTGSKHLILSCLTH